jgi:hypothetical protein
MSARTRIGLAAIVVALAGLFAMHGLSPHGAAHPSPDAMSLHASAETGHPAEPMPAPGDSDGDELLTLCLALLVAGLVALAVRRPSYPTPFRDFDLRDPVAAPEAARRDRDPPDLHVLSIQRC